MTLLQIYDFIKFIGDKDFNGNFFKPEDFGLSIITANLDLYKKVTGLPEEYQPGSPIPRELLEINQKSMDEVRHFKQHIPAQAVASGYFTIPDDYIYWDSMSYIQSVTIDDVVHNLPRTVEILRESQASARRGNWSMKPTLKYPIAVMRVNTQGVAYKRFYLYPDTIASVEFHYYRLPVEPVFAYNIVDDELVYDAGSSTEFEWGPEKHTDLIHILLSYLGINLRKQQLINYAEMLKAKGI